MGTIKVLCTLFFLVLNFIGAIFLFTKLAGGVPYYLEIIYILIALFVSLIFLLGAGFDAKWSGPFGLILFAVNMANAVCLYLIIGAFFSFVLLILVNAFGILTSLFSISDEDEDEFEPVAEPVEEPVETYDAEEADKKFKKRKK